MMNTLVGIKDLPLPPPNRTGWPWTEETSALPDTMPNGEAWPRISIVTPSFNQGQFIEETIRSVLLQGYPNLEYIIIDGGSTDESVEIIKKYEPWLTYWVSEKDRGQAHAINKGMAKTTGVIFNWSNSDDVLMPLALSRIATAFNCPEKEIDAVAGSVVNFTETGEETLHTLQALTAEGLLRWDPNIVFVQPGLWLRPEYITAVGGLDEKFHYSFDWDMIIRYLADYSNVHYITEPVVRFRLHPHSKTVSMQDHFVEEEVFILQKIRENTADISLRSECKHRLQRIEWSNMLKMIDSECNKNNVLRAARITSLSCLHPRIRWSRITLGAVKKLLLSVWI